MRLKKVSSLLAVQKQEVPRQMQDKILRYIAYKNSINQHRVLIARPAFAIFLLVVFIGCMFYFSQKKHRNYNVDSAIGEYFVFMDEVSTDKAFIDFLGLGGDDVF